jgi:protein-disulfide isomerase
MPITAKKPRATRAAKKPQAKQTPPVKETAPAEPPVSAPTPIVAQPEGAAPAPRYSKEFLWACSVVIAFMVGCLFGIWLYSKVSPAAASAQPPQPTDLPADRVGMGTNPAWGPANAKTTAVLFIDYECPSCEQWMKVTYPGFQAKYDSTVRFTIRDFPLPFHPDAESAAESTRCASEQGKYWAYVKALMDGANPSAAARTVGKTQQDAAARTAGLDVAQFQECRDSGQYAAQVAQDIEDGKALGVNGTPYFFFNGHRIIGPNTLDVLVRYIE